MRNRRHQHLPLSKIAFENFGLDVSVDGQVCRFGLGKHRAVSIYQAGKKSAVTWTFVLRPLLRLNIEVNPVEALRWVNPIKLHDFPHMTQEFFPVFACFVGILARKQRFHPNIRSMEKGD